MVAIGGVSVLILLILVYLLKYVRRKSEKVEADLEQTRRAARAELKKAHERILSDGERPAGENEPDGEVIPVGKGNDGNGGGRWFVIEESYIWAVQNNGRDGDNWALNNVVTDGHGAIGARIAADPEWADYIRSTANAAK